MNNIKYETEEVLRDIEEFIKSHNLIRRIGSSKIDWRTYQQRRANEIKLIMKSLKPIIDKSTSSIFPRFRIGRTPSLDLNQKVTILLFQKLIGKSNRSMDYMLTLFSSISGSYLSYKTIERLYSDKRIYLSLLKMRELLFEQSATIFCPR